MALPRHVVKGSFLSESEDLLKKVLLLSKEDARILRILKIFSGLQINNNAVETSPDAITARNLVKELTPTDRCRLLKRMSEKSVPYCKPVKPMMVRMIANTFIEDGSLWLGNPHMGGLLALEGAAVQKSCEVSKLKQASSEQFAEPIMAALLCNFREGNRPSVEHFTLLVRFAGSAMALTPRFVALTRHLERHIDSALLDHLTPDDSFRLLRYVVKTVQVHPDPDVALLKTLVTHMPDVMRFMAERTASFRFCESLRTPTLLRVRHTPCINALAELVLASPILSLPLLTVALSVSASFHVRNAALEARALEYVRLRRAHQLMTNPVTMHELAWSLLALRGEIPAEVVPYATASVLRYLHDDLVQIEALPFLEQTADALPLDAGQRAAYERVLHTTSLLAQRASRAPVARLAAADGNVLVDVAVGPLFAHAVAMVTPDGRATLPWPADLAPARLTPATVAAGLAGTPVALMVIPETDRRRLKPHLLMALSGIKRRQLEARGWTVAVVSHGELSLRDAWFPAGSGEVYPIDDAAVLRRAVLGARAAAALRDDVADGLARDDSYSYSGDTDLGSYETYNQDFLTVLFARELGVRSPVDAHHRSSVGERQATDLLLESAV